MILIGSLGRGVNRAEVFRTDDPGGFVVQSPFSAYVWREDEGPAFKILLGRYGSSEAAFTAVHRAWDAQERQRSTDRAELMAAIRSNPGAVVEYHSAGRFAVYHPDVWKQWHEETWPWPLDDCPAVWEGEDRGEGYASLLAEVLGEMAGVRVASA